MKKMVPVIMIVVIMPCVYAMRGPKLQPKPRVSPGGEYTLPAEQRKSKQALPRFNAGVKTSVAKNNIQQQQHTHHSHKDSAKCTCVIV